MNFQSLPPSLQNASQIRHTSEVNSGEPIFLEIRSDLEQAGFILTRLLRIDNSDLKEKFQIESEQLKKTKQYDKDFKLNIQNLYHGTTAPLADICDEGLDVRLSRKGRFGRGIYFSDNPEKCCKYAESRTVEPYLLRCQVILGDIKEFPPGQQDVTLTREPVKGVVDGRRVYYDSVKGNPREHTEYVIYERRRILLEYIAFYSSSHAANKTNCLSATSDQKQDSAQLSSIVISPPTSNSERRDSSSGSSRSSSPSSTPPGSPRQLPNVSPRSRSPSAGNSLPSGVNGTTASKNDEAASSSKKPTMSRSAMEQQRLAFQKLVELKGNIPETDLNELIRTFTATYGSIPTEGAFGDGGNGGVPIDEVLPQTDGVTLQGGHQEDDPILEVMRKVVAEFKEVTCCDDETCRQFLENYDMNLDAALHAYYAIE